MAKRERERETQGERARKKEEKAKEHSKMCTEGGKDTQKWDSMKERAPWRQAEKGKKKVITAAASDDRGAVKEKLCERAAVRRRWLLYSS